MKKILVMLLALAMIFVFAACGNSEDAADTGAQTDTAETDTAEADASEADTAETDAAETDAEETAEEDGYIDDEPYFPDIIGDWQDRVSQRATLSVLSEENGRYEMEISWGSSATERRVWHFTGIYDPDSQTWTYDDCVCVDKIADSSGSETDQPVFENGTGTMVWKIEDDHDVLVWHDDHSEYDWDNEFVRPEA